MNMKQMLFLGCWASLAVVPAAERPLEGELKPFLGPAHMDIQQIFTGGRMPNIVVTRAGTVLVTWGTAAVLSRRSEDGGKTWGPEIVIAKPGFQGGGTTVDESTGDILAFVEDRHPPAPLTVYRSKDDGKIWQAEKITLHPDSKGHVPSMHMNEHGITLRHGEVQGPAYSAFAVLREAEPPGRMAHALHQCHLQ
jgi:sialidase-1